MPDERPRKVVIVDDIRSVRRGLALELAERSSCDLDIETCDFEEALAREDYDDVDYVILDLARGRPDDDSDHEYPSFFVVEEIKAKSRGRGPWIIMVTGEGAAHDSSLVNRMVAELGVDYFIERTSLEEQLDRIFTDPGVRGIPAPNLFEQWLRDKSPVLVSELGVTKESSLAALHRYLIGEPAPPSLGRGGGADNLRRSIAQQLGRIRAVSRKGEPLSLGRKPTNDQLKRLKKGLTRLPRSE